MKERDQDRVELEIGGVFRINHRVDYPEWAEYFDKNTRCERCWEKGSKFSKIKGTDRWICQSCKFLSINSKKNGTVRVLMRKVNAQICRLWWNYTHDERFQIPNRTGHDM